MILTLASNSASAPLTLDLTPYVDVADGDGLDFANPAYSTKIWSHSLLREGATESLEQTVEREIVIPLKIGPIGGVPNAPTTLSATMAFIAQINQALRAGGATLTWQPDGTSQATVFDAISGQVDVVYKFRAEQQKWTSCTLRFFAQPFGRTAGPRPYAAASGVGPLLMISPYASSGALAIGASTQAGVAGYGGQQQGASSGVFYWGSPSLAGDAPALLQVSYVGPLPNTATNAGVVPTMAVSVLPDKYYQPLLPVAGMPTPLGVDGVTTKLLFSAGAVGSTYWSTTLGAITIPLNVASAGAEPTSAWVGLHRLLAISRASGPGQTGGTLALMSSSLNSAGKTASVYPGDWQLLDLGTISLKPSQIQTGAAVTVFAQGGAFTNVDLTALVMLPDNATWFLSPTAIQPSQYGWPLTNYNNFLNASQGVGLYTNTLVIDDLLGDQFIYGGASQRFAPSPAGAVASSERVSVFSRGLVPRPDPRNGLPIVAIVGVGQMGRPSESLVPPQSIALGAASTTWANPQNIRTMAQLSVVERSRYVLP